MRDMQILPKLSDSISFLYLEQVVIHRNQNTVEAIDQEGRILIPVATLSVLMLGPGVSISHAAINILAKNGCSVVWVGEDATRFYASGMGESYKAYKVIRQAELVSDPEKRKKVVLGMYFKRFDTQLDKNLSLPQIRGLEGVRVRKCYQEWSQKTGVDWQGRSYNFQKWGGDPINRALSTANAVMNAVCTAVVISAGYSTALGFIHQGRQYSFVYDVADLYKTEITIPAAFKITGEGSASVEKRTRLAMRDKIKSDKLIERILADINELLECGDQEMVEENEEYVDPDQMYPFPLWEQLFEAEGSEK
jgi:CRISPR-associated protein Cas1